MAWDQSGAHRAGRPIHQDQHNGDGASPTDRLFAGRVGYERTDAARLHFTTARARRVRCSRHSSVAAKVQKIDLRACGMRLVAFAGKALVQEHFGCGQADMNRAEQDQEQCDVTRQKAGRNDQGPDCPDTTLTRPGSNRKQPEPFGELAEW